MTEFTVHTIDTAPAGSRPGLMAADQKLGFVPNMMGVLAESPAALEAYQTIQGIFGKSTFTPAEQQFVALVVSVANGCTYCVPAYTMMATKAGLPADVLEAARDGGRIADDRYQALREFTLRVVERRGRLGKSEVDTFLAAGFTRAQALDVIVAAAFKLISNYTNHIAEVPLDAPFQRYFWKVRAAA